MAEQSKIEPVFVSEDRKWRVEMTDGTSVPFAGQYQLLEDGSLMATREQVMNGADMVIYHFAPGQWKYVHWNG